MITFPLTVPVDLNGPAAQEAARRELAKPEYQEQAPGILDRIVGWISDRTGETLDRADAAAPGGPWGWLLLLLVAAIVVAAIAYRTGGLGRSAAVRTALLDGPVLTAANHREEAERHAAAGRWAEAVRERLRAVVRTLEDRGVLDARPGRTADEVAADAAEAMPGIGAGLRDAVRAFDEIWYGGREATSDAYGLVRRVDEQVASGRRVAAT